MNKNIIPEILCCFILCMYIVSVKVPTIAHAQPAHEYNIQVLGDSSGISIVPSSSKIFDISGMLPGDKVNSIINISNNYEDAFELYLNTERLDTPAADQADLYKKLQLTVKYMDASQPIYEGPMDGFPGNNAIDLGNFSMGGSRNLIATVSLGTDAGNEYQGLSTSVKWIFTAQSEHKEEPVPSPIPVPEEPVPGGPSGTVPEEPVPGGPSIPKTGEVNPLLYYALGIVLFGTGMGIMIFRQKNQK